MVSENEFILIIILLILLGLLILKLIINKTIDYTFGGIFFLILIWIIDLILNNLGFTTLAYFFDGVVSFPTKFVEYLKLLFTME